MTTPEKFRRRQRIEAALIILIGLAGAFWALADEEEEQQQQQCVVDNFGDLSRALSARSDVTARDTALDAKRDRLDRIQDRATHRVINVAATAAEHPQGVEKRFAEALEAYRTTSRIVARGRVEVRQERQELAQIRRENPLPPYPAGTCDETDKDLEEE